MRVTVRTIGALQLLLGSAALEVWLPAGSRVDDLVRDLVARHGPELKRHLEARDTDRVPLSPRVLVNGRDIGALEGRATVLRDADDVLVLTPMAGG